MLTHLLDLSLFILKNNQCDNLSEIQKTTNTKFENHTYNLQLLSGATEILISSSSISHTKRYLSIEILGTLGTIFFKFENKKGKCVCIKNGTENIVWEYSASEDSLFRIAMTDYLKLIIDEKFSSIRTDKTEVNRSTASLEDALNVQSVLN